MDVAGKTRCARSGTRNALLRPDQQDPGIFGAGVPAQAKGGVALVCPSDPIVGMDAGANGGRIRVSSKGTTAITTATSSEAGFHVKSTPKDGCSGMLKTGSDPRGPNSVGDIGKGVKGIRGFGSHIAAINAGYGVAVSNVAYYAVFGPFSSNRTENDFRPKFRSVSVSVSVVLDPGFRMTLDADPVFPMWTDDEVLQIVSSHSTDLSEIDPTCLFPMVSKEICRLFSSIIGIEGSDVRSRFPSEGVDQIKICLGRFVFHRRCWDVPPGRTLRSRGSGAECLVLVRCIPIGVRFLPHLAHQVQWSKSIPGGFVHVQLCQFGSLWL